MAETLEAGSSRSDEIHPAGSAYDVFISFRGEDTRYGITDVLYTIMTGKGICVFRDTEEIRHGKEIGDELCRAIPDSRIYVVVFSKDYASSAWCLRELAMMVDSCGDKASGKVILPIFYKVSPSDVKLKTPLYRSALAKHRKGTNTKKYKEEDVKEWEEALKKVGGISGLEYQPNTGEGKFVSDVVADILNKLKIRDIPLPDHLIGMDDCVKSVLDKLNCDAPDVRVVMLCGMGGIGKTTLAKVIFNKISTEFNGCSFLEGVREWSLTGIGGVEKLQKQLLKDIFGKSDGETGDYSGGMNEIRRRLSRRKVLIIFDDVSESSQLKKLVGKFDFFGQGTRIIVTTRDRSVCEGLMGSSHICYYGMKGMSYEHALQLFNRHAFGGEGSPDNFVALSKQVIRMTGNLPLALEVIGGHLNGKEKDVWEYTLEKLKKVPDERVVETLKISYDSLGEREKQIFLDIACFANYEMPRKYASYMWEACGYHPKCGLEVLQNRCLIKVLNVVDDDEYKFWKNKDKYWMHDLIREMGREIVRSESLLHSPGMRSRLWDFEEALNVVRQREGTPRVLAIHLGSFSNNRSYTEEEFKGMSNLRFVYLRKGAQLTGDFSHFRTKLLWLRWEVGFEQGPKPGFFNMDNLVILEISGPSVSDNSFKDLRMGKLRVLDVRDAAIRRMPDLSHCSKLELITLYWCDQLEELHSSIGVLWDLKCLKIEYCPYLRRLPEELGSAKALQELTLIKCNNIRELPESIGSLGDLRILSGSINIRKLPSSIGNLKGLEVLEIIAYDSSRPLRKPSSIEVPTSSILSRLSCLYSLTLSGLYELGELQELPSSLTKLTVVHCSPQLFPNLASLTNLTELELEVAFDRLPGIEKLHRLQKLMLDFGDKPVLLSTELGSLSRLEELRLTSSDISSILRLPSSLRELTLEKFQTQVPWVRYSNLQFLHRLYLSGSWSTEIRLEGLGNMRNLSYLDIDCCNLEELWDLASLGSLCCLCLRNCRSLIGISGVERMVLLEELLIYDCRALRIIPDLSDLTRLKKVEFTGCHSLQSVPGMVEGCHLMVYLCGKLEAFEGYYGQYHFVTKNLSK